MSDPSVDISGFDHGNGLNASQFAAARATVKAANAVYDNPPKTPAMHSPESVLDNRNSVGRQRQSLLNTQQAGASVAAQVTAVRATNAAQGRQVTQSNRDMVAGAKSATAARNAGWDAAVQQIRGAPAAPSTAPAAAPPASPPPPSGGSSLASGPFGPDHPFYAQLTSPPPIPTMPTAAPTAGLDTTSKIQFGSPGAKLIQSAAGKTIDAVGKVVADAARPRASAPTSYTSGPGWRTN